MATRATLPVIPTAITSWRLLIAHWRFSLLIGLPLVAFVLLVLPVWRWLAAPLLSNAGAMHRLSGTETAFVVWELLMDAPLYVGLSVALVPLHRRILLGEERRLPFRFGQREAAYGAFLILLESGIGVLIAVLTIPMINVTLNVNLRISKLAEDGVIPGIVGDVAAPVATFCFAILVAAPMIYVYTRLCLALPAMAVGTPTHVAHSWRMSRGNGWRLVAVTLLVSLPGILLAGMVLVDGIWSADASLRLEGPVLMTLRESVRSAPFVAPSAAMALWAVIHALVVLPEAAALSLAYKRLAGANAAAIGDVFS